MLEVLEKSQVELPEKSQAVLLYESLIEIMKKF